MRNDRMTQQALSRQKGVFMKIILIGANGTIGLIRERVLAGLARAKEQGTRLGRRRIEDAEMRRCGLGRSRPACRLREISHYQKKESRPNCAQQMIN
jgi:hypothetical protein